LNAFLSAAEPPYCAYEVRVGHPSGEPFAGVGVALILKGTEIAEARTDAKGVVRICDAPLASVDIVAGFDVCGSVGVRHVNPLWLQTRKIDITFDGESCHEFSSFPTVCHVLLRVVDDEGRALSGARFNGMVSDVFGRLIASLDSLQRLAGFVAKEGYAPGRVSAECDLRGNTDLDLKVLLQKRN
jgi:hypothetical protein